MGPGPIEQATMRAYHAIRELVKNCPNDQDLGRKVRELVSKGLVIQSFDIDLDEEEDDDMTTTAGSSPLMWP